MVEILIRTSSEKKKGSYDLRGRKIIFYLLLLIDENRKKVLNYLNLKISSCDKTQLLNHVVQNLTRSRKFLILTGSELVKM